MGTYSGYTTEEKVSPFPRVGPPGPTLHLLFDKVSHKAQAGLESARQPRMTLNFWSHLRPSEPSECWDYRTAHQVSLGIDVMPRIKPRIFQASALSTELYPPQFCGFLKIRYLKTQVGLELQIFLWPPSRSCAYGVGVPGCTGKQNKQAMGSRPVNSTHPRPQLQFLPLLPSLRYCNCKLKQTLSSPSSFWSWCLSQEWRANQNRLGARFMGWCCGRHNVVQEWSRRANAASQAGSQAWSMCKSHPGSQQWILKDEGVTGSTRAWCCVTGPEPPRRCQERLLVKGQPQLLQKNPAYCRNQDWDDPGKRKLWVGTGLSLETSCVSCEGQARQLTESCESHTPATEPLLAFLGFL